MLQITKVRSVISIIFSFAVIHTTIFSMDTPDTDVAAAASFGDWQVVGPSGGDVRVVAIDPKDKNRIYISTLDGQIHTSGDGGKTWRLLVNLNQPELVLDQLFVDSRD